MCQGSIRQQVLGNVDQEGWTRPRAYSWLPKLIISARGRQVRTSDKYERTRSFKPDPILRPDLGMLVA